MTDTYTPTLFGFTTKCKKRKEKKRKEQITKDAPTFFLFIIFIFDFR